MERSVGRRIVAASVALASVFVGATLCAQATQNITLNDGDLWHGRPYLLSLRSHGIVEQTNWWRAENGLQAYARAHPEENYLLFVQDGTVYRLDTAADLDRLEEQRKPMEQLAALQTQLSASMGPLTAQQQTLSTEMRATHDPHLMGRIGHEQGIVGARQGEIGRQQGVIGRQQGILGRAFYQSTQELIDRCLQQKTCSAVAPAASTSAQR